jgi:hypothetical protein
MARCILILLLGPYMIGFRTHKVFPVLLCLSSSAGTFTHLVMFDSMMPHIPKWKRPRSSLAFKSQSIFSKACCRYFCLQMIVRIRQCSHQTVGIYAPSFCSYILWVGVCVLKEGETRRCINYFTKQANELLSQCYACDLRVPVNHKNDSAGRVRNVHQ